MEYGTFPIYLGSQEHTNEKGDPCKRLTFFILNFFIFRYTVNVLLFDPFYCKCTPGRKYGISMGFILLMFFKITDDGIEGTSGNFCDRFERHPTGEHVFDKNAPCHTQSKFSFQL